MVQTYLKLILIGSVSLPISTGARPSASDAMASLADSAQVARRVATTARLAAEEFSLGVQQGKVVLAPEVEEARLFLSEARRAAAELPASHAGRAQAALAEMIAVVDRPAPPDSLAGRVEALAAVLTRDPGVTRDQPPPADPPLA